MTYDVYRYIFIGAAILCGVMIAVSILIFILLNIPKVISDLSGATARKAIKAIREQNEASGDKSYKVSPINEARGKLTDKISPSGNIIKHHSGQMWGVETSKIETQELVEEEPASQTTVLDSGVGTTVLGSSDGTTVLDNIGSGETAVLSTDMFCETTELVETNGDPTFVVEYEITYIHSNELIVAEGIQ